MTNPQVKAKDIATQLREKIERGELAPGKQLATVRELAAQYGVAYNTISRAIGQLKSEGLLKGVGGGPTRVRVRPTQVVRSNRTYDEEKRLVLAAREERERQGVSERTLGIPVRNLDRDTYEYNVLPVAKCPAQVGEILELSADEQVLRRRHTRRHVEHAGDSTSTSYLPHDVVRHNPRLLDPNEEPWPGGTLHQLWTAGREVGRIEDRITARMPTKAEQEALDIPPGIPLLDLTKITYDTLDRPVEVAFVPLPADRVEFRFSTDLERW
ncbi:GntR family transcriptional regulator [Amycolatopsis minnesotensis]|uniref:GntR family transcriptional regulator n=1 Tax=Amycolatopsis minnesotensis TaxID=337894 RepID=A0ABN2SCE7_9PSEU